MALKGIFAGWPASNNNDCHLLLGEKFSFIGTVTIKRLLPYNFIRYSLSRQNWFKEIRKRKNDKSRRFTQGFIDKFGNKFLFWLVCYCCVGLLLFLVLDAHWSNSEKIKSNMAAVEWKIQRAGEVSLFYLLNKTSTISWARVKFSLSFLTERFNFQPHPYLKNCSWKFSLYEYAAFKIVEQYAKFTTYIILIWTRLWKIILTHPLENI